ncbi:MAG: hypothetical protein JWO93_2333, partial [Micrococcaceae bacterium]|nr:hypothetical protein [Micrococcaceae bacterium]
RSEDANTLDTAGKVELAIVASGARADLGQAEAAVAALEIPQLDMHRAFSYSPRLFRAYADALEAVGRTTEAATWKSQAVVAEDALGIGEDQDPFIVDLGAEDEDDQNARPAKRSSEGFDENGEALPKDASAAPVTRPRRTAATGAGVDDLASSTLGELPSGEFEPEDAESDFFDSDDAESDEFSAEADDDAATVISAAPASRLDREAEDNSADHVSSENEAATGDREEPAGSSASNDVERDS